MPRKSAPECLIHGLESACEEARDRRAERRLRWEYHRVEVKRWILEKVGAVVFEGWWKRAGRRLW